MCAALALVAACNIENPGDSPPRGLIYFPNALALSKTAAGEAPAYLFVANSNFDLRYNAGTVQAFSLDRLGAAVDRCRGKPACEIDPQPVLEDEVRITSFSTAIGLSSDGKYLFAATRTDDSLLFVRVNPSAKGSALLSCPTDSEGRCALRSDGGKTVTGEDGKPLPWPPDPEALIAGSLSDWLPAGQQVDAGYVMVAHKGGELSLFAVQPGNRMDDPDHEVERTAQIASMSPTLTQIAYDPVTKLIYLPTSTSALYKVLGRAGIVVPDDLKGGWDVDHAYPYNAGVLELDGAAPVADTSDVTFIPALPNGGASFAEDRALIVSQEPSALLVADVNPGRNAEFRGRVEETTVVGTGATRLAYGDFEGHPLAVVGSFGTRELAVIELPTMVPRAVIPNLSGPYALAMDEPRRLLYIAEFRSSVIRIVDLAPVLDPESDQELGVTATLGHPRVLQELK